MSFEFIEDIAIADVAFRARGATLEEVFAAAARATLRVMVEDLDTIARRAARPVELRGDSLEWLLFDFLQEFIFYKDAQGLLLLPDQLQIEPAHRLRAVLRGERLDPERHALLVDVKAVTLHRFSLVQTAQGWVAEVVLDI